MIETLIGTLFGGIFRLFPEVVKFFDRDAERKHELAMFDKQLEADKLKIAAQQQQAESAITLADIAAMLQAAEDQFKTTGIPWVDAVSALMRPLITFWWVIVLYTSVIGAKFYLLMLSGNQVAEAIVTLWGPDEKAIAASIIAFWFVDRSLRKNGLK